MNYEFVESAFEEDVDRMSDKQNELTVDDFRYRKKPPQSETILSASFLQQHTIFDCGPFSSLNVSECWRF